MRKCARHKLLQHLYLYKATVAFFKGALMIASCIALGITTIVLTGAVVLAIQGRYLIATNLDIFNAGFASLAVLYLIAAIYIGKKVNG